MVAHLKISDYACFLWNPVFVIVVVVDVDDNDDDNSDGVWEGVMMSRPLFTLSYAGDPTRRQKLNGYW